MPPLAHTVNADLGRPRWRGHPGRIEVWYATFTGADGTGYWIHYETVAPSPGGGAPYGHGWAAAFPPDASPAVAHFGPDPLTPIPDGLWFRAGGADLGPDRMTGEMDGGAWNLEFADTGLPLHPFPAVLWGREAMPGAQVVPWPRARVRGTIRVGLRGRAVDATGAVAHIYEHGNPECWCWLHADLGEGDVLEVVAAVPRWRPLRRLPPVAFVQLRRVGESDWPANPLLGAVRFHTRLGLPRWSLHGAVGRRRLRVEVTLPPERCVTLTYRDPDGSTATCTNSERADVEIVLERRGTSWGEEKRWALVGTAHAEVGRRP